MQNHVKYLVVDDVPEWANNVGTAVRDYFESKQSFAKARIREVSAYDATQADQRISEGGWDLVMLDMNLGAGAGKSRISGLDLLGEIAAGNKAYFVIIVTGAVTDPTLEKVYGKDTAALLRLGALNEAVRKMPASRVRILHKPEGLSPDKAIKALRPHLESALDQYCSVSLERNIFRPLPGDPGLWEICYNGGPRITLKHEEHYKLIRSGLAQPSRAIKLIQMIQSLAQSSGRGGATIVSEPKIATRRKGAADLEYSGHQNDDVDSLDRLDFHEMDGFSISDSVPVDTDEGTLDLELLIHALLNAHVRGLDLRDAINNMVESYGEPVVISLPGRAAAWAARGDDACRKFNSNDAPPELMSLARALKLHLAPMREKWLKSKGEGQPSGSGKNSGKVRVARGVDMPELALARQHWSRFKKAIGNRPALATFREHMIQWVDRSPTAKGHFHYRPPGGTELCPFWLTE